MALLKKGVVTLSEIKAQLEKIEEVGRDVLASKADLKFIKDSSESPPEEKLH